MRAELLNMFSRSETRPKLRENMISRDHGTGDSTNGTGGRPGGSVPVVHITQHRSRIICPSLKCCRGAMLCMRTIL